MLMLPPDDSLNEVGRLLGPNERFRMIVPGGDVATNVGHDRLDGVERATTNGFAGQNTEPHFHEIQPRGSSGGEVKLHARMGSEPRLHGGCRMGDELSKMTCRSRRG